MTAKSNLGTKRWLMLVFGMICMLVMGICYTYGLFHPYIMKHFNVESASASLPFTVFIAVFCVGNYIGGVMQRKMHLKMVLIVGYALMAAGWIASSVLPSESFALIFLTYSVLFGIGDGIVYNVIVSLMPKWFPDRKGMASGLALAMLGMSATVFSPVVSSWLSSYGYAKSFLYVGFVYLAIGIFGTLTLSEPPADYAEHFASAAGVPASTQKQYTLKEALKVKDLYTIMGLYFCAVPAYLLLSAIFVTYGSGKGLTADMAK